MGRITTRMPVHRVRAGNLSTRADTLAVEEPLEIRVDGSTITMTMRTPGADIDLVHGFLWSEGALASAEDIAAVRYCDGATVDGVNTYNVVDVTPAAPGAVTVTPRAFATNSACGVCGSSAIDVVADSSQFDVFNDESRVQRSTLSAMPDALRAAQSTFSATGGTHGAALFTTDGELLAVREDVGRHNAVDKVIGWAVREGRLPLRHTVLMTSSRVSFELVQKAAMAGIPIMAAVSAPSSLAVALGRDRGITVVGFLRGESMNIYSHEHRITD